MEYLPLIVLNCVLFVSAVTDIRFQKIPNMLTFPAVLTAIIYHSTVNGLNGLLFSVTGLLIGIALLIFPYLMGGMGAGDAKLLGVVGAFIGADHVFYAFLLIAIIGGLYAVLLIFFQRFRFKGFFKDLFYSLMNAILTKQSTLRCGVTDKSRPRLCYGLAIASGASIYTILLVTEHNPFI